MRDNIRKLQAGGVAGCVRIADQCHIITERNGAPNGGVDAILRLTAADNQMRNIPLFQDGLKLGLMERIAASLFHQNVARLQGKLLADFPSGYASFQLVTRTAVMLHHDDRDSGLPRLLLQAAQPYDDLIKGMVDSGLPFWRTHPGHDVVLNIYDEQSCFHLSASGGWLGFAMHSTNKNPRQSEGLNKSKAFGLTLSLQERFHDGAGLGEIHLAGIALL